MLYERLIMLVVAFLLHMVRISGAFYCWECSSKDRHCSQNSLRDAVDSHCGRTYNYCAIYKTTFPNGSTVDFTRACTHSCQQQYTSWETRRGDQVIKHCLLCCGDRYNCNDLLGDPCSTASIAQNTILLLLLSVMISLAAQS